MKSKNFIAVGMVAMACLAGIPAHAQEAGWYIGASFGYSDSNIDTAALTALGVTATKDSFGPEGGEYGYGPGAFQFFGGYQFNKNSGVELSYVDLEHFFLTGTFGAAEFGTKVDVTGWSLAAVGTLPLFRRVSLFGKFGAFYSKIDAAVTTANPPAVAAPAAAALSGKQTDYTLGIGAKIYLGKNFTLRLEANHYELGDKGDASFLAIAGVQYKF